MGEVYRARDGKLNRDVAIKVLPATLAGDADYMARFQREAQALAALNHPNIAQIYGFEGSAIVMELVDGRTLAERIAEGRLPLEEALPIAKQIAEALEASHEKGVVHRDLKPGNIKITPEGVVKVLDFGLAKTSDATGARDASISPTLTIRASEAGLILGTAGYMSPEQASGKPVDRRADIWSFGVVLWEMLTGRGLFEGETISHTLAHVLTAPVDFSALPAEIPAAIRELLRRCLDRNVRNRLRDIGEARVALQNPKRVETAVAPVARRSTGLWAIVAAILLLATLALGYVAFRHVTEQTPVLRLSVLPPEKATADMEAVSPDGLRLAFVGTLDGKNQLWVRELDSLASRQLSGTEGATYPFWSPDSRAIAFFQAGRLKRIDAAGGPALTLSDASNGRGGSWNQDGVILFAPGVGTGIFRVAATGGNAIPVTELDLASGENAHRSPAFLPDGRHFLYTARNNEAEKNAVYVADLKSKERRTILAASSNAVYALPGFLLFVRERTLMAQPFDAAGAQTKGEAVPVADLIRYDGLNLVGRFSVSHNGVLTYTSSATAIGPSGLAWGSVQLTWFDRTGNVVGTIGTPGISTIPAISPDGHTVAFDRVEAQSGSMNIWLHDLARGTESRFTFNAPLNQIPVWSPDGTHIAFSSALSGKPLALVQRAIGGTAQDEILDSERSLRPSDWSRDGRYIIGAVMDPKTKLDIWVLPLFGDRKAFPYLNMEYNESWAKLSPNGQWLAYTSDETKRSEVYVQSFPHPGRKSQISTDGGIRPVWSRDGKQLFFIGPGRKMMAVDVNAGASFEAGVPKPLFDSRLGAGNATFDVSKDGRFLIPARVEEAGSEPITVVINWTAGLKK